jgi:undecaprenyl-diphosphatase
MTLTGRPAEHQLFVRHRAAMVVAFAFFVIAILLFVLLANPSTEDWVQAIDDGVRDAVQRARWGPFTVIATALNILGAWYVTWPLRLAVAGWLWAQQRWEALVVWLVAMAVYEPLVGIVKELYRRQRPPSPDVAVTGFAFPSGHATVGAAIAIGLVMVVVRAGPRQRIYEVLAGGFAFLMGASRVYLDAHWLSDVVAGTAMGAAVMIGVGAAVHEVNDRLDARSGGDSGDA